MFLSGANPAIEQCDEAHATVAEAGIVIEVAI